MRLARMILLAAACALVTRAAWAKRPPMGPFAAGRLEVRVEATGPLGFCDVVLERDGAVVGHGKPDRRTGTLTFENLLPGRYDVHAVSTSFVPRAEPGRGRKHRVAVWMRYATADASKNLRERRDGRTEIVKLRLNYLRRSPHYMIGD